MGPRRDVKCASFRPGGPSQRHLNNCKLAVDIANMSFSTQESNASSQLGRDTASCDTRLLPDLPADDDAFGSHLRVAKAMIELVLQESGGRAVALTGSWGSGKSTVVKLLGRGLKNAAADGGTHATVFTFDAWAHRGDPLRRSFLEELTAFLVSQGWAAKGTWDNELETLRRRREESETRSDPVLTVPGRLLALSALLVPVGNVLLGKIDSGAGQTFGNTNLVTALSLAFAPVLVALGTWLAWRPTWRAWRPEFWTKHRGRHERESIFTLFVQTTRHIVRNTTVRNPDPTSLEFGELFTTILAEVLQRVDRRLVIVIDNLDRIDTNEATAIWSTMRTFFRINQGSPHPWTDHLWLIVPIDESAAGRLWRTGDASSSDVSNSFLQKTFQVSFGVAPPVLSDWSAFLISQMREALPNHEPLDDLDTVYRIFRIKRLADGNPVTPREIKLFVNQLGALHRQWQHDIPLTAQAAYVLFGRNITHPSSDIASEEFLDRRVMALLGDLPWRKYFAALHFNVEPDKAMQTLAGQQVEQALTTGDAQILEGMATLPGIWHICEHVVEEQAANWAAKDPGTLARAALALHELDRILNPSSKRVWKWLGTALERVDSWMGLDRTTGDGITAVLVHNEGPDHLRILERVLTQMTADSEAATEASPSNDAAAAWLEGALSVLRHAYQTGQQDAAQSAFRIPGDASFYVAALKGTHETTDIEDVLPSLVPSAPPEDVIHTFVSECEGGRWDSSYSHALSTTLRIGAEWSWAPLSKAFEQRLQANTSVQPDELVTLCEAVTWFADLQVEQGPALARTLVLQGHLLHHWHTARKHPRAAAACALLILEYNPNGEPTTHAGSSAQGVAHYRELLNASNKHDKLLDELVDLITRHGKIGVVLACGEQVESSRPMVRTLLRRLWTQSDALPIEPESFAEHFRLLRDSLEEDHLRDLAERAWKSSRFIPAVETRRLSAADRDFYSFVLEWAQTDIAARTAEHVKGLLREFGRDQWVEDLTSECVVLVLALTLVDRGLRLNLPQSFDDALTHVVEQSIEDTSDPISEQLSNYRRLALQILEPYQQATFLRNVRDLMLRHADRPLENLIRVYGQPLIEAEHLLEEKADDIVRRLLRAVISRGLEDELRWLADVARRKPKVWMAAEEASRLAIRTRIQSALSELPESTQKDLIRTVAAELDIPEDDGRERTERPEDAEST